MFGIIAILLRGFFKESAEFLYYKKNHADMDAKALSSIKLPFILAILLNGAIGGVYHFLVIFLGVFLSKIVFIIDPKEAYIMNIVLIITYAITAVFSGFLADKINPFKQIIIALVLSLITALTMQVLLYKQIFLLLGPITLIGLAAFYAIPLQLIIQSLFSPLIKMRFYSLSHSLGGIILSSSTPFFSMLLWRYFESLPLTLSFFIGLLIILISSVITLTRIHMKNTIVAKIY
jgi:MFS family permease